MLLSIRENVFCFNNTKKKFFLSNCNPENIRETWEKYYTFAWPAPQCLFDETGDDFSLSGRRIEGS